MDADLVRAWKAGHEAANAFILEEQRTRSVSERIALLEVMQRENSNLEALKGRADSLEFHLRWNKLRELWLARKS